MKAEYLRRSFDEAIKSRTVEGNCRHETYLDIISPTEKSPRRSFLADMFVVAACAYIFIPKIILWFISFYTIHDLMHFCVCLQKFERFIYTVICHSV